MKLYLLFLALFLPFTSFSQKQDNIWIFGKNSELDFNTHPPTYRKSNIQAWQQSASISDEDGNLLFYTDGGVVYDRLGNQMPNGNLESSLLVRRTPSIHVFILKSTSNQNQYYIFKEKWRVLNYSVVDISLNSGLGAVIQKQTLLTTDSIADIFLMKGANCFTNWLVATSITQQKFLSFKIDLEGIHEPVSSLAPNDYFESVRSNAENFYGSPVLQPTPDYQKVILPHYVTNPSLPPAGYPFRNDQLVGFEILDFNPSTGIFSPQSEVHFSYPSSTFGLNWLSSFCFSPSGQYLYATRTTTLDNWPVPSVILEQFDFSLLPDTTAFKNSRHAIDTAKGLNVMIDLMSAGAPFNNMMRNGPDGKIYLNTNYSSFQKINSGIFFTTKYFGCIQNPDQEGNACNYQQTALTIPATNWFRGSDFQGAKFPGTIFANLDNPTAFIGFNFPSPVLNTQYKVENTPAKHFLFCPDTAIDVSISGDYDNYEWFDGSTESQYHFTQPGTYWVYKYKGCQVTIDSFVFTQPEISLPFKDTTICKIVQSEIQVPVKANVPGSFKWNTGVTDSVITINRSGTYIVKFKPHCTGSLKDTISLTFEADCNCQPFVPNAFTPNGDGLNDRLEIQTICPVENFQLSIFNRYGQRVFFSYRIKDSWDGLMGGKLLPMGTYFYQMRYETPDGKVFQKKGKIDLLR